MSPEERAAYLRRKMLLDGMTPEERAAYEAMSPEEREAYMRRLMALESMTAEERAMFDAMSPEEREAYLRRKMALMSMTDAERAAFEAMSPEDREAYLRQRMMLESMSAAERAAFEAMSPEEREKFMRERAILMSRSKGYAFGKETRIWKGGGGHGGWSGPGLIDTWGGGPAYSMPMSSSAGHWRDGGNDSSWGLMGPDLNGFGGDVEHKRAQPSSSRLGGAAGNSSWQSTGYDVGDGPSAGFGSRGRDVSAARWGGGSAGWQPTRLDTDTPQAGSSRDSMDDSNGRWRNSGNGLAWQATTFDTSSSDEHGHRGPTSTADRPRWVGSAASSLGNKFDYDSPGANQQGLGSAKKPVQRISRVDVWAGLPAYCPPSKKATPIAKLASPARKSTFLSDAPTAGWQASIGRRTMVRVVNPEPLKKAQRLRTAAVLAASAEGADNHSLRLRAVARSQLYATSPSKAPSFALLPRAELTKRGLRSAIPVERRLPTTATVAASQRTTRPPTSLGHGAAVALAASRSDASMECMFGLPKHLQQPFPRPRSQGSLSTLQSFLALPSPASPPPLSRPRTVTTILVGTTAPGPTIPPARPPSRLEDP